MKKVRFIRPGYFVWIVVPVAAYLAVVTFGLPHMLWSYAWSNGAISYGDIAGRHYTRCTYIGPYGVVTVHPVDGSCDLFRLFRSSEAPR